jgi:hypothetical protein
MHIHVWSSAVDSNSPYRLSEIYIYMRDFYLMLLNENVKASLALVSYKYKVSQLSTKASKYKKNTH